MSDTLLCVQICAMCAICGFLFSLLIPRTDEKQGMIGNSEVNDASQLVLHSWAGEKSVYHARGVPCSICDRPPVQVIARQLGAMEFTERDGEMLLMIIYQRIRPGKK